MQIKDRLLLSGFAGGISAILANIFLYILNIFIPGKNINMPELTAEIFLNVSPNNIDLLTRSLGFVWSLVIGGLYALMCIIALEITGWNKLIIKVLMIIVVGWVTVAGFMMRLLSIGQYVRDNPLAILAFFIAHIFFALILSSTLYYCNGNTDK